MRTFKSPKSIARKSRLKVKTIAMAEVTHGVSMKCVSAFCVRCALPSNWTRASALSKVLSKVKLTEKFTRRELRVLHTCTTRSTCRQRERKRVCNLQCEAASALLDADWITQSRLMVCTLTLQELWRDTGNNYIKCESTLETRIQKDG